MNKRVALIYGHPDTKSYNHALAEAYKKGALASGIELKEIILADLDFNPNLQFGYRKRSELEPDLLKSQEILKWADHLVWVYPIWWGSVPAIMKGFLDRVLLPDFAFSLKKDSFQQEKLFKGKTSRIICTLDQPNWYYQWIYRSPSHNAMKKLTLNYIGIQKVHITTIGPIRLSKKEFRLKWLNKVEKLGRLNK